MARSSAAVVQLGGLRAISRYQFDRSVPVSRAEGECRRGRTGVENRFSLTGDRGFESCSLQRRGCCEPDFLDHGWRRRSLPVQSRAEPAGERARSDIEQCAEPTRAEANVDLIGPDVDAVETRGDRQGQG
jgi:hypothetical protein